MLIPVINKTIEYWSNFVSRYLKTDMPIISYSVYLKASNQRNAAELTFI